ncbi:MAG: FGGY family carbohydrate kinase [Acidimicrobiales bacterium]
MALVLGAALGPYVTHVEVRDAETGLLRATGAARHSERGGPNDDPARWWRSLVSAVGQTSEREIAAISVTGSHPSLVVLDGAGAVLQPTQPWPDLAGRGAPDAAVHRLAWLKRSDPATLDRLGMALLPHDWLTHRLTGRPVTDRASASLTGAWAATTEDWRRDVLRDLAPRGARDWWRDRLPTVLGPSERADWLDAPMYDLLGLRGRPIVGPGTTATTAIALALGLRAGRVAVSLDSTTTALVGLAQPISDRGDVVRCHADAAGRHLAVASAGDGIDLLDTIQALFDIDARELHALSTDTATATGTGRSVTATGLAVVPEATGAAGTVVAGLTAGTTRRDVVRATVDGIACAALDRLDLALRAGGTWADDEPLRLGAPRAHIELMAQVLADLSSRAVRPTAESSLAAAGACIQAAAVLTGGPPDDVADAWDLGAEAWVEPADTSSRQPRRQAHADAYARQQRASSADGQPSAPPARSAVMRASS